MFFVVRTVTDSVVTKSNINFCILLLTSETQLAALCNPYLHFGLFWQYISPSKSDIFNTAPRHKEETFASFTAIIECYVFKS
jgi:hypothetical protein